MRPILLILPALALLAACAAGGGFKSPADMSPQELCDNATLALALVEANAPEGSKTVERARVNHALLCGTPLPRPAE